MYGAVIVVSVAATVSATVAAMDMIHIMYCIHSTIGSYILTDGKAMQNRGLTVLYLSVIRPVLLHHA